MKRGGCAPDNTGKLNGRKQEVQQSQNCVQREYICYTEGLGWSTKQEQLWKVCASQSSLDSRKLTAQSRVA